ACLWTRLRQRLRRREVQVIVSSAPQGGGNGQRDAAPFLRLRLELAAAGGRELIVAGAAVVVGLAPARGEPARLLHPVKGGEERARLHHEGAPRDLLDAMGDGHAVFLAQGQGLQDQQIQGALQQVGRGRHHAPPTENLYVTMMAAVPIDCQYESRRGAGSGPWRRRGPDAQGGDGQGLLVVQADAVHARAPRRLRHPEGVIAPDGKEGLLAPGLVVDDEAQARVRRHGLGARGDDDDEVGGPAQGYAQGRATALRPPQPAAALLLGRPPPASDQDGRRAPSQVELSAPGPAVQLQVLPPPDERIAGRLVILLDERLHLGGELLHVGVEEDDGGRDVAVAQGALEAVALRVSEQRADLVVEEEPMVRVRPEGAGPREAVENGVARRGELLDEA